MSLASRNNNEDSHAKKSENKNHKFMKGKKGLNTLTTSRQKLDNMSLEIEKSKDAAVRRSLDTKSDLKAAKISTNMHNKGSNFGSGGGLVSNNYSTVDFVAVPEANIEIGRIHSDSIGDHHE